MGQRQAPKTTWIEITRAPRLCLLISEADLVTLIPRGDGIFNLSPRIKPKDNTSQSFAIRNNYMDKYEQ